jgi:hypothetical protein
MLKNLATMVYLDSNIGSVSSGPQIGWCDVGYGNQDLAGSCTEAIWLTTFGCGIFTGSTDSGWTNPT